MPWDFDADVQVTEGDMYYLAAYYNMTVYYYKYAGMPRGRYFLLDINPAYSYRERDDALNFIDARWIDMQSGLFIDITAARYDAEHEAGEGMLYDKNEHEYRVSGAPTWLPRAMRRWTDVQQDTYVFPLRDTTFEGVPAKIPFRYQEMLESEYGKAALMNNEFNGYVLCMKHDRNVSNAHFLGTSLTRARCSGWLHPKTTCMISRTCRELINPESELPVVV